MFTAGCGKKSRGGIGWLLLGTYELGFSYPLLLSGLSGLSRLNENSTGSGAYIYQSVARPRNTFPTTNKLTPLTDCTTDRNQRNTFIESDEMNQTQ